MKNRISLLALMFIVSLLVLPLMFQLSTANAAELKFAQTTPKPPANSKPVDNTPPKTPPPGTNTNTPANNVPPSTDTKLINLSRFSSITELVFGIINYALAILGVLSTLMIIYGGFLMVLSGGNEERLGKGKKTLTWAIVGLAVALLSFSIVAIVQNVLNK